MAELNFNKKALPSIGILILMLFSLIPIAKADITIVSGTKIDIGDGDFVTMGKDITFPTPIYYSNGLNDGRGFWINCSKDFTLGCWFENNWLNYTPSGLSYQRFFNGSKPTLVILGGVNKTEGYGWSYDIATQIVLVVSMLPVQIFFGTISLPPSVPATVYQAPEDWAIIGNNIAMYFSLNEKFATQMDTHLLTLKVTAGTLNAYNTGLYVSYDHGICRFTANENVTLQINGTKNLLINVNNTGNLEVLDSFNVTLGETVQIEWWYPIQPIVPFIFMLGMIGLCCMVGGPLYAINKIKQKEIRSGMITGLIITALGFGLFMGWLFA